MPRKPARWTDLDGNRSILDANGNIQYNEVAAGTSNFGQCRGNTRPDPDLKRGYNWEYSVSVQHELMPKVSVTAGYYRRQIRQPARQRQPEPQPDRRLELVRHRRAGRFALPDRRRRDDHDVQPEHEQESARPSDTLVTFSTLNNNIYNGFEFSANARFGKGFFFAGVTTERSETLDCDGSTSATQPRDNPNGLRFCDNVPPFRTQFKGSAAYTIPWDVQVSGSFQSRSRARASRAELHGDVGDCRTADLRHDRGAPTISVNLIEPNTLFLDYQNQLDARVGKTFRFGRFQAQGFVDIFNVLNAGTVTSVNTTYGANPATRTWMNPTDDSHRPHDPVRHAVGVLGEGAEEAKDAEAQTRAEHRNVEK